MKYRTSSIESAGTINRGFPRLRKLYRIVIFALVLPGFFIPACRSAQPESDPKAIRRDSARNHSGAALAQASDLYALVVGVSKYRSPRIKQLNRADKDARDFGEFLKTQNKLFRRSHITVLCNEDANRAGVIKYLSYELRRAGKGDTVILFFSGHGADDSYLPGEFFFLTHDSDPENLDGTAVKMNGLSFLKRIDAERVVLIADACHAGGFSLYGTKAPRPSWNALKRQFAQSSGKVMITSSRPEEVSVEKPGMANSVFTHYLLEGLKGKADKDQDGLVTAQEAYDYTYRLTKDETEGRQHPQFESGRMVGAFPIAIAGGVSASLPPPVRSLPPVRPSPPQATLALKTYPGNVRVQLGSHFVGESDHHGLLEARHVTTGVEHQLTLYREGFKTRTLALNIPHSYGGQVCRLE